MGFLNFWIAVKGGERDRVLSVLGLKPTGEWSSDPCPSELTQAGPLNTGWFLVMSDYDIQKLRNSKVLSTLSTGNELITCGFEEHCMQSTASCWRDGVQIWSIEHDSDKGNLHLDVSGTLPPEFQQIRSHLMALQVAKGGANATVDFMFSVPTELTRQIVGFSHDHYPAGTRFMFEVVA